MTGCKPRRLLVHAPGQLGERLAGPQIRALEFAKALSCEYQVTLAAQCSTPGERDGIRVVPSSRRRLMREAARHGAVLAACLPPYLLAMRAVNGLTAIADLYDPLEQELATLDDARARKRALRERAAIHALHLRHADVILCANQRQRRDLLRTARALLGPGAELPSPAVVPFGIPDPPSHSGRRPLRDAFPQISDEDKVVLWWGSVWRWLDAETPVRAFARIASNRTDVKLVITAGSHPNDANGQHFDGSRHIRALADELGLLGRTVFFIDEWIPYELRHDYLREADIGLTLHRYLDEARLAARSRYMDYLSADLPCVLGRGDELAEELSAGGFATLLDNPRPETLATVLLDLVDDPRALAAARSAGQVLAAERHWSAVAAKLRAAVGAASPTDRLRRGTQLGSLGGVGAYYLRQVVDRLAGAG